MGEEFKYHLVNWRIVCTLIKYGDLGLRQMMPFSASTVVIGVDGVQGRSEEGIGSIYGSLFVQMESFCQVCVISSQKRNPCLFLARLVVRG